MESDLQNQYSLIINEIRRRIISADILSDKLNNVVLIESTSLQIRKILELIAYLSVLVNHEKLNHKARNEWHAEKIINALNANTTIFYPFPSFMIPADNGSEQPMLIPIGYTNALSQHEFIDAYNMCGNILHAQHPFKSEIDIDKFAIENKKLLKKLKNLLQRHTVGIKHEANKYTFLHVEIDFTNNENTESTIIQEYKTQIFSEDQLKRIFSMK